MASSLGAVLQHMGQRENVTCVECGRPVHYLEPKTAYERLLRTRQVNHRLCERCARTTGEVGEDLDGLRRKKRFLRY